MGAYIGCPVVSTAPPSGSIEPAEAVTIHVRLPANFSDEARSPTRMRSHTSVRTLRERVAYSLATT